MDILTKVRMDHSHIHTLLKQIISQIEKGNNPNGLLEDLLEEVKEHLQAEKVCLSEMFLEKERQKQCSSLQINKEAVFKLFADKLYQNLDKVYENKELGNKLRTLEKLLQEHSHYVEDIILFLCQECISDQKSEDLSLKFEQEKIKTLISGISYA